MISNCVSDNPVSPNFFGVLQTIFKICIIFILFAFWSLEISVLSFLDIFAPIISLAAFIMTYFALILFFVERRIIVMKVVDGFYLPAFRASFFHVGISLKADIHRLAFAILSKERRLYKAMDICWQIKNTYSLDNWIVS